MDDGPLLLVLLLALLLLLPLPVARRPERLPDDSLPTPPLSVVLLPGPPPMPTSFSPEPTGAEEEEEGRGEASTPFMSRRSRASRQKRGRITAPEEQAGRQVQVGEEEEKEGDG